MNAREKLDQTRDEAKTAQDAAAALAKEVAGGAGRANENNLNEALDKAGQIIARSAAAGCRSTNASISLRGIKGNSTSKATGQSNGSFCPPGSSPAWPPCSCSASC